MKQSKHTTQDPMAEKYMGYSPYNYCVNSPINFVDPNGMGDFWFNGVIIGNDGIDDKRVLVIKTTAKSFGNKEDLSYVLGAGLSNKEQKTTVDFIKKSGGKNIKFLCIIAAPEGIKRLAEAHPDIEIYIGNVDRCLNENAYICPGLGDAGDRIFGTK